MSSSAHPENCHWFTIETTPQNAIDFLSKHGFFDADSFIEFGQADDWWEDALGRRIIDKLAAGDLLGRIAFETEYGSVSGICVVRKPSKIIFRSMFGNGSLPPINEARVFSGISIIHHYEDAVNSLL